MGFGHIYQPDGLNITLLSQGCVLENGSSFENGGLKVHSKDWRGDEEPLIAQVRLESQQLVTSS